MNFRPRHEDVAAPSGAVPMTSMIDVVFLLLVFFLVTSSFTVREDRLSAAARAERSGAGASDLTPQVVDVVRRDGRDLFVIGETATPDASALESLLARLPKGPGVAVRVEDDATVSAAAAALQAARNAGFEKRSYVPATPR